MTHARRRAALVLASVALGGMLAGCVTAHAPPTNGATAKLVVRHWTPNGMKYDVFTFDEAHACVGPQRIVAGDVSSAGISTSIRAGPLATLQYRVSSTSTRCDLVVSFYPRRDHTYLLEVHSRVDRCSLRLLDATDPDNPRAESMVRRTFDGLQCNPLATAATSAEVFSEDIGTGGRRGPDRVDPSASLGGSRSLDDFRSLLEQ